MLLGRNRVNTDTVAEGRLLPNFKEVMQISVTFFFTVIAWVFFRAETINHATTYISSIFSASLFSIPEVLPKKIIFLIVLFILIEWFQREKEHALQLVKIKSPVILRWALYYGIIIAVWQFAGTQQQFIYFQF
jgi:uncharacterized membrane protein (DUF4010 family)